MKRFSLKPISPLKGNVRQQGPRPGQWTSAEYPDCTFLNILAVLFCPSNRCSENVHRAHRHNIRETQRKILAAKDTMDKRGKSSRSITDDIRLLTASHCTGQVQASDNTSSMQASMEMPSAPSGINEKALTRKIDLRVLPTLFIIYVAAFLDR